MIRPAFLGWRRLGSGVLLEFEEETTDNGEEQPSPFAPRTIVRIHMAIPGPCRGPFVADIAPNVLEVVAAICSFALGRPVDIPPTGVFASKDDAVAELDERRRDPEIHDLARNGISLDILQRLADLGGPESALKARDALIAFDSALRQSREQVACILFVAAAECLANPRTEWKRERLTKRFIDFFRRLMPEDLDEIVNHDNFEDAFGIRRGRRTPHALRRELLSRIYDMRSEPVHEGLGPSLYGLGFPDRAFKAGARRALVSDFAQMAILRFLEAPQSSLIGHPDFEPDVLAQGHGVGPS